MYQPQNPPPGLPPQIEQWLMGELRNIADAASQNNQTQGFAPLGSAPNKPREGYVAYANGTTWNPTGTAGLHEYRSGAWVKL